MKKKYQQWDQGPRNRNQLCQQLEHRTGGGGIGIFVTGRSGWWLLILLVPLIGILVLLFFLVQDGQNEDNEYGPSPKLGA